MNDDDNIPANKASELKPLGRRPGPPKGVERPPGAGRKKGTPNRATRDVREAAQKHTAKALKTLVQLLADPDSRVQATAARELLDRAHGKPMTPTEVTGKDGAPLSAGGFNLHQSRTEDIDLARRITFLLKRGEQSMQDAMQEALQNGEAGPNVVPISKGLNDER